MFETYTLFVGKTGAIHLIPHPQYVELVQRTSAAPQFAGQSVRVADFYVRHSRGTPDLQIENETYTSLCFGADGIVAAINRDGPAERSQPFSAADPPAYRSPTVGSTWVPSRQERERLIEHLRKACGGTSDARTDSPGA